MKSYFLLLWKSSLNLPELEQKVGHSWASSSQNRLPNKVRREWPENMVKTSQWRVTQWRDLWLIGQSFSVLESVFIPSDDQIPAWEEQTTSLPMCIGQGPWDPQRPPCRHEPGEQIKKSPWLSSRIQTWSGASFKMTSASASSSFTSSGCLSARFADSVGSWALDKMSISSVYLDLGQATCSRLKRDTSG